MADLTFSSYLQGPLGEAIRESDTMGALPPPTLTPAVKLTSTIPQPAIPQPDTVEGGPMRLLGPGDVAGLAGGTVVRADPPAGAVDVEPNYMTVVEIAPAELPWVLTPAKAAAGRLRPWFVLVVVEEATAPMLPGNPLPTIEADVAQLPDLRDSWGWAHVQRTTGPGALPGGGEASAATVARLVCPRRLSPGVTYRACLVPAFDSGVDAGLGKPRPEDAVHDLAWKVESGGSVRLPVYHQWTFTTGPSGDFEKLVSRLQPADPEALRVSSVRLVDVRAPWPGDELAEDARLVGVQGALVPFGEPPIPEPAVAETLAAFDARIRAHLDAPARRILGGETPAEDVTGSLAPPLYGGRHVSRDLVDEGPPWVAQLNTSVANRIAAGLGADYVRAHQEDLMAKAWLQVGQIREANRLRAVVELTSEVAEKVHEHHVARLKPGELVAFAAPASAKTKTSAKTTLAMETRMSRMVDGTATSSFARRVRRGGKLARRTGVSVGTVIPRALTGEVSVPGASSVIPDTPTVAEAGLPDVAADAAAMQLVAMTAMVHVAELNDAGEGAAALGERIDEMGMGGELAASISSGSVSEVAEAITEQVGTVAELTSAVLADMSTDAFGSVSATGVPIVDTAIAERVVKALRPGNSHRKRLATQTKLPGRLGGRDRNGPVMASPDFPVPTALTLLDSDPEWFMPGLGALPANRVALLRQNGAFIESYLVGMNHEMMRELLWREYPTDRRGTPFTRFWPRPDGLPDIPGIATWSDAADLGTRLTQFDGLSVLLVRGDVVRRYPGMVVTAVRSGPPDAVGAHRPDPGHTPVAPTFVISVDESTIAYAFAIQSAELTTPASPEAPGWFFVFAEHGFRIRFGFDDPEPGQAIAFDGWEKAAWPAADGLPQEAFVPVDRGHAIAGADFGPPSSAGADSPTWNRDSADIARITLQRPFRVAVQADVLLQPTVSP